LSSGQFRSSVAFERATSPCVCAMAPTATACRAALVAVAAAISVHHASADVPERRLRVAAPAVADPPPGCGDNGAIWLWVTGMWGVQSGASVTTPACSPNMLQQGSCCKALWPEDGGSGSVSVAMNAPIKAGDKFSVKARVGRMFVYVPFEFSCVMCGDDVRCPIEAINVGGLHINLGYFVPPKCPSGGATSLDFSAAFVRPVPKQSPALYVYVDQISSPYFNLKMEGWVNWG